MWSPASNKLEVIKQLVLFFAFSLGAWPAFISSRVLGGLGPKIWVRIPRNLRYTSLKHLTQCLVLQRSIGFPLSQKWPHAILSLWKPENNGFTAHEEVRLASLIAKSLGMPNPLLDCWSRIKTSRELSVPDFLELKAASLSALFGSGRFQEAFSLSKELTTEIDNRLSRKPGLWAENHHFSAVGHLALLHYLLIAVESGKVRGTQIDLHRCSPSGNEAYADWLQSQAGNLGVLISQLCHPQDLHHPNLELWPSRGDYEVSWHNHGETLVGLEKKRASSRLLTSRVSQDSINYLSAHGWDSSKPTIGFHIQNNLPRSRGTRNSPPEKYELAMLRLIREGYNVVLLGRPRFKLRLPGGVITLEQPTRKAVADEANLFVWQSSEFFVGSLSGGTHPPGAFLTPTLWVDQHPITSFRAPGAHDLFLPKLVYLRKNKHFLTLRETFEPQHSGSQTENPGEIKSWGYGLREVSALEIDNAVREMQEITQRSVNSLSQKQERVAETYAWKGFRSGGNISFSFVEEWGATLGL